MGILERIYQIERMLRQRRAVSMRELQEHLEVSRATVKRDIEYMRDRLNAPLIWDRTARGYRIEGDHELPSLYLSKEEVQALLVLHHLITRVQPTIAQAEMEPLRSLLAKFAGAAPQTTEELTRRVRILQVGSRFVSRNILEAVTAAVLGRRRLDMVYRSRSRGKDSSRIISPARLVYYRDNWYVDAWCHSRMAVRSFALDAIRVARTLDDPAQEVPEEELDRELGAGYGIFAGSNTRTATLRFSALAARWVSGERWHKDQVGCLEADGSYTLRLPYSNDTELVRDVLRYGPEVEVVEPPALRDLLRQHLRRTLRQYRVAHSVSH
jgi:predicted DNA-binding transcriptional regulator YafY